MRIPDEPRGAPSAARKEGLEIGTAPRAGPILDRKVIEGVRRRDGEALGRFFELTFDSVYGLAFRLVGERAAAEDIAQEVFLRVHRSAGRLDPGKDPLPWLRKITANLCRDHWRSFGTKLAARSVPIDGPTGIGDALGDEREASDDRVLSAETERLVQEAINELPGPLREAVVLRDYEGLGHDEIARIVGASGAAVRKRYSRALATLAGKLRDKLR